MKSCSSQSSPSSSKQWECSSETETTSILKTSKQPTPEMFIIHKKPKLLHSFLAWQLARRGDSPWHGICDTGRKPNPLSSLTKGFLATSSWEETLCSQGRMLWKRSDPYPGVNSFSMQCQTQALRQTVTCRERIRTPSLAPSPFCSETRRETCVFAELSSM